MSTVGQSRATVEDLYKAEGKAELIGGRIVHPMASGFWPGEVASAISDALKAYARATGVGVGTRDGVGYVVPELPSGRESFAPDAAYFAGPVPERWMRFIEGPPTLAVEVRSENDYTPSAEQDMAEKRADYFAAGTLVVWDVDPIGETVAVYRSDAPTTPTILRRGDVADAEPAVPGWRMAVDDVFP
jgi:Uma2 family endonuclease